MSGAGGIFNTGHTPMVGTTANQLEEVVKKEFTEEYRAAHDMKTKKGPVLAKICACTLPLSPRMHARRVNLRMPPSRLLPHRV